MDETLVDWREKEAKEGEQVIDRLAYYLKGDADALRFCVDIMFLGHLWDDLIDKDKERTPEEINRAFMSAFGTIPQNPFYQAFQEQLRGLVMSAILQWQDANILERTRNPDEMFAAYIARNGMAAIVHYCMFLVGGPEWCNEQGPSFWREMCAGMYAKYEFFLSEMNNGHS
jgi:hypothetical protein